MRRILGGLLLLVSLVGCAVYLHALLDPVGAKLADDGDPFGHPGTWHLPALGLAVSLALGCAGSWLALRRTTGKTGPIER